MYKSILKSIKTDIKQKESLLVDLCKNVDKKHAIHNKLPHFIFSAENPLHESQLQMTHDEAIDFLTSKGYNVEGMSGKYGTEERSILVHNPPKNSWKHLNSFAASLGQDSSIISDGYNHEMHYLNGSKKGRHHKGESTVFHKDAPADFFSTLEDGSHFTHAFDWDKTHRDSQFLKDSEESLDKSERFVCNGKFNLKKAEDGPRHKLDMAGPDTKLIHYSPKQGLEEITNEHHGVRKIGSEAKQGAPEHKMSFHYAEGVEPESIVTTGAKSKYVSSLGNKKLYDIAKDRHGLWDKTMASLQEKSQNNEYNKGIVMPHEKMPAFHQAIKDAGFHGIYNSGLEGTMGHAVGMFESMKPDSEHPMHQKDYKKTSATNHHEDAENRKETKNWAKENGHHNHKFLHNLKEKVSN